jgi:hypothetical protein
MLWRALPPANVYSPARAPPATASRSPRRASGDEPMSKPVIATTPPKAMPSPASTCQRCLVPLKSWKMAIHADWRHTRAVAAATDVSCSDVMKQAKCRARATAASSDQRNSRRVTLPNWAGSRMSVGVAITAAPMALRQKAMERALTLVAPSVAAIRGPEEATPSTPRAAIKRGHHPPRPTCLRQNKSPGQRFR